MRNHVQSAVITPVLVRMARALYAWRQADKPGRTFKKVEAMTRVIGKRLFPIQPKHIDATRLCRLEAWREPNPYKTRDWARIPMPHELPIIATLLGKTVEELIGTPDTTVVIRPDSPSDMRVQAMFESKVREHLGNALELIGWAEFLPCSLETAQFMRAHHESIFTPLYEGDGVSLQKVLQEYNNFGDRQRERLYAAGAARPWKFTHLMFRSDFDKIVSSPKDSPDYCGCTKAERIECLNNLADLIIAKDWNIELRLTDEKNVQAIKRRYRDFDSVVVLVGADGNGVFTWKRNHIGELWMSENPEDVTHELQLLLKLRNDSAICNPPEIERAKSRLSQW